MECKLLSLRNEEVNIRGDDNNYPGCVVFRRPQAFNWTFQFQEKLLRLFYAPFRLNDGNQLVESWIVPKLFLSSVNTFSANQNCQFPFWLEK